MTAETGVETARTISDEAWQSLQGAYDLQVHGAPDVIPRRIDDLDLGREFLARGLRGFVLKSTEHSQDEAFNRVMGNQAIKKRVSPEHLAGLIAFLAATMPNSLPAR